jgi:hypothetical protein
MPDIRGGYDNVTKQVLNLTIKNGQGHIMLNHRHCPLEPLRENTLELVNYNGMYTLLLNQGIIFEHTSPFLYILKLDSGELIQHYTILDCSNDIMRYLN